jgi:hypothetical protein
MTFEPRSDAMGTGPGGDAIFAPTASALYLVCLR